LNLSVVEILSDDEPEVEIFSSSIFGGGKS
jgi:hypothetical protein